MEDVYHHMRVMPHDEDSAVSHAVPPRLSPQFSLAFLRQASDPAMLLMGDGHISFLNDAACALFGLGSVEEVRGRLIWELWGDPDAEPVLRYAIERAAGGEAVRFPALTDVGEEATQCIFILSPVVNAEGEVESIFALTQTA